MVTRTHTFIPAVLLLTLVVSGCSASPDTGTTDHTSTTGQSSSKDSADLITDPLSEYTRGEGVDSGDFVKRDKMIQACMQAQGFEYTIVKTDAIAPPPAGVEFARVLDRADAEEHGYGIVETSIFPPGYVNDLESDPNYQMRKKLSKAQQAAYDKALYGEALDQHDGDLPVEKTGCNGKAAAADSPDQSTRPPIIDDAEKFQFSLATAQEVTEIKQEWAKCFADAGYSETARADFEEKITTFKEEHPEATTEDPAVDDLRSEEVAIAVADADCAAEVDLVQRTLRAMAELEKDYIAEHKGELEEVKLWLNQTP